MKKLFLNCCFLLFIGQANAFDINCCRSDDINPSDLFNPSLTIRANFYHGDEDESKLPLAETEFYLLDKSLIDILKDSNFKPEFPDGKRHKLEESDYLTASSASRFKTSKSLLSSARESSCTAMKRSA